MFFAPSKLTYGCSFHLQNRDRESKFRSWLYNSEYMCIKDQQQYQNKLSVPATSCRAPKMYTDKQTDLVLEVTPPEALESDKNQNQKPKKSGPMSTNLSFFDLCPRQAELKQVSFLKQTNYTNITVHFLFFFRCSLDTEGDTSNPICRVF